MSMSDLEQFFDLIEENQTDADFDGQKPIELIEKAERALGIVFPPTYRKFVERFGCGDVAGFEIYGVLSDKFDESGIPDAIWLTLDARKTSRLPSNLLLVSDVGDGSYYAIDCNTKNENGDCPVVMWMPNGTQSEPLYEDFGAFAKDRLQGAVA